MIRFIGSNSIFLWLASTRGSAKRFFGSLSILVLCNIGTQIVSIVGFLLISRIFEVTVLGEYLEFLAIVTILSIVSTGNYDQALFVDRRRRLLKNLIFVSIFYSITLATLTTLILKLSGAEYALAVGVTLLSAGLQKLCISFNVSRNRHVVNAFFLLMVSPIRPVLIVLCGAFYDKGIEIMIATYAIASISLACVFLIRSLGNQLKIAEWTNFRFLLESVALAKRYIKFLKFGMVAELFGTASLRVPIIIAAEYFEKNYAAYYGVAFRLVVSPILILVGNIAQLFKYRVSENKKSGLPSLSLFAKYLIFLILIGIAELIIILTSANYLVIFFLTETYAPVSDILIRMLPYIIMLTIVSPLTSVLAIFEKQEFLLYNKISFLIVSCLCFGYGVYVQDFYSAITNFSISMSCIYIIILVQVYVILKLDKNQIDSHTS
jgi:O-antigen/teichoic acid export membrane protein